jgi:hypothetical protein
MFKQKKLLIFIILGVIAYFLFSSFNTRLNTPESGGKRVTNLPWQITHESDTLVRVFDIDIGQATLADADRALRSEYELAWFYNQDQSISLEAYFIRVNLSGLRARIILELDPAELDMEYLLKNSGKPEKLPSYSIKYPLDDLKQALADRKILSLTYIPKSSVDKDLLLRFFGKPDEVISLDEQLEHWLYPHKGLDVMFNPKGKEMFQYTTLADFERMKQKLLTPLDTSPKLVPEK